MPREDDDVYTPSPPEFVSPDEPIIFGRRWKAERDAARAQAEALAEAMDDIAYGAAVGPRGFVAQRQIAEAALRAYRSSQESSDAT